MRRCLACSHTFDSDGWACPVCGAEPGNRQGFMAFAPELAAQSNGYDPQLFAQNAELEAKNFWFAGRNTLLQQVLRRYLPSAGDVLEIGCGTGFVLAMLRAQYPSANLWASDIFSEGLPFAAGRVPSAHVVQMDATALPFRDAFDLVGAFDVIEHIDDDRAALAEMTAALRPGGTLLLTVPQHPRLWSRMDEYAHHKRRYTSPELLAKLGEAGLRVRYATSFVSLLLPAMAWSRWRQAKQPPVVSGVDPDLQLGAATNASLSAVMAIERGLLAARLRLPVGGSLLAVAQKG